MQLDQKADILHRLRCASGHLIAVTQMVESETPCDQVMYQLKAVEAALRIVARKLITCQAESIQAVILKSSSQEERMAELYHLQTLCAIFIKCSDHPSEVIHD